MPWNTHTKLARKKLDVLQGSLDRLKRELAEAWVSPDGSDRVAEIEGDIRRVWDEMGRLALRLSEPSGKAPQITPSIPSHALARSREVSLV